MFNNYEFFYAENLSIITSTWKKIKLITKKNYQQHIEVLDYVNVKDKNVFSHLLTVTI